MISQKEVSMVGALVMFVLLIIFYIIVSHIITILFRLTGMTEEKARFQVVSLLTNSGYTTQESETVVKSKMRRRLAMATMLFGYAFTVTILSAMVNVFMAIKTPDLESVFVSLPILLSILLIFFFVKKSSFFHTKFDSWVERVGNRMMFGRKANEILLVEEYGKTVVAHVYLHTVPAFLQNVTLAESRIMPEYHVMVLLVKSPNGEAVQANAHTILKENDTIMVMGDRKVIREIFEKV